MNKKLLIGTVVVLVVAAAAFGYWYYQRNKAENALEQAGGFLKNLTDRAVKGVLPSIDPKSNPMENAPDTNPVSKTNPFTGVKTNPFK